ncbi:hypothetical protein ACFX19_014567 [Malus domestica]
MNPCRVDYSKKKQHSHSCHGQDCYTQKPFCQKQSATIHFPSLHPSSMHSWHVTCMYYPFVPGKAFVAELLQQTLRQPSVQFVVSEIELLEVGKGGGEVGDFTGDGVVLEPGLYRK